MAATTLIMFTKFCVFVLFIVPFANSSYVRNLSKDGIHKFHKNTNNLNVHSREKRDVNPAEQCITTRLEGNEDQIITTHEFDDTHSQVSMVWLGHHAKTLLVVTSSTDEDEEDSYVTNLYLSTNEGKSFVDITKNVQSDNIHAEHLQRHKTDMNTVYLVSHEGDGQTYLHVSFNRANNFTKVKVPFLFSGSNSLIFSSKYQFQDRVLYLDTLNEKLYMSLDKGITWTLLHDKAVTAKWSESDAEGPNDCTIYATVANTEHEFSFIDFLMGKVMNQHDYDLMRMNGCTTRTWSLIHEHVNSFGVQGKFIYVSMYLSKDDEEVDKRILEVSSDGGETFYETLLPSLTPERFFSVLDMSEGLVFMHVDEPGEAGFGTLYTSGAQGVRYSVSLERHLYPDHLGTSDFYKVESMRNVYFASQLEETTTIHSLVTYDRGGEWQRIPRPMNKTQLARCPDESRGCYLQIHNQFSSKFIDINVPKSHVNASGLILVHGHVADSLLSTPPDVYISNDGGYNWYWSLEGPHEYEILDGGGLLLAVQVGGTFKKEVKVSTDQGNCWETLKLNVSDAFNYRGMVTEPTSQEASAVIFGFDQNSDKWLSIVVDFKNNHGFSIPACEEQDMEEFVPHLNLHTGSQADGCVLGKKETFKRVRQDAWCLQGIEHSSLISTSSQCPCTSADYECDYGYYRPDHTDQCIRDPEFKGAEMDICERGHKYEVITKGYRKIPGTNCTGSVQFAGETELLDLKKLCVEGDKKELNKEFKSDYQSEDYKKHLRERVHRRITIALVVITIVTLLTLVALLLIIRGRRRRQAARQMRYRELQASSHLDNSVRTHTTLYDISSDDNEQPPYSSLPPVSVVGPSVVRNTAEQNGIQKAGLSDPHDAELQLPKRTSNFFHEDSDDVRLIGST